MQDSGVEILMAGLRLGQYRERIALHCRWACAALSILSWNTEGWGVEAREVDEQLSLSRSSAGIFMRCASLILINVKAT
jgi:hypothetical protein